MDSSHRERLARAVPEYELGSVIGRGQFGVVWGARHRRLEREVAVKELDAPTAEDAGRFDREARVLAGFSHPHIVTVYDYRVVGEARLLIMERLGGGTLAARHRSGMTTREVVAAAANAATGLQHAHDRGVLHRDVTPGNLMFDDVGVLKVTDFGIATDPVSAPDRVRLTSPTALLGTPAYLAPEQAARALGDGHIALTAAADQYGLAAVLYELLSGKLTHDPAGGVIGLCRRRVEEPAAPLSDAGTGLSPTVCAVVMRALATRPQDRFGSMGDFADALTRALADADIGPGHSGPANSFATLRNHETLAAVGARAVGGLAEPDAFVGRESEGLDLAGMVERYRLVTVVAAGGTGKTRLVRELLERALITAPDGVWFVDLAAEGHRGVAGVIARTVGLGDEMETVALVQLEDRFCDRNVVVILDNCEHVVDSVAAVVQRLLAACPGLRFVATSRQPLKLRDEQTFPLDPLAVAPPGAASEVVASAPASQLLVARARRHQPSFAVTEANADAVGLLVRRLDGIPLAIELAATRLRSMSVGEIADRLDERFRLLTSTERDLEPRQRTLLGAIQWSYGLLSDAEQRALACASLFVGGFDLEAAEVVLGHGGVADRIEVIDLIASLVEKSLVVRDDDPQGRSRYRLLESIQVFANDRLDEAPAADRSHAREAHFEHYCSVALGLGPQLAGPAQIEANTRLSSDHGNLFAALTGASELAARTSAGLRLAVDLRYYWTRNGIAASVIPPLARLCTRSDDDLDRSGGYAILSRSYSATGQIAKALDASAQSVAFAAGERSVVWMRALQARATALSFAGEFAAALSDLDEVCAASTSAGEAVVNAESRSLRAMVKRSLGADDEARSDSRAVVEWYRSTGDVFGLATELVNLADFALGVGDLDETLSCLNEAEPLVALCAAPELESYHCGNRGLAALLAGDRAAAAPRFAQAVRLCVLVNDRQGLLNNAIGFAAALASSEPEVASSVLALAASFASRHALIPDPNELRLRDATLLALGDVVDRSVASVNSANETKDLARLIEDHFAR